MLSFWSWLCWLFSLPAGQLASRSKAASITVHGPCGEKMKNYDYVLVIITIGLLVALGFIFIYGAGYSYLTSKGNPNWTATSLHQAYLDKMNKLALPLALGLVVALGLCIPKRIVPRNLLLQMTLALLAMASVLAWSRGTKVGLGFLLITGALVQTGVVGLTLAGSKILRFEHQGFFVQLGSALLHLGIAVFLVDIVLLQATSFHIAIFWLATVLIMAGSALSFYSEELFLLRKKDLKK